MKRKVAVIGSLTIMGRALLDALSDKGLTPDFVHALDSRQNLGVKIPYGFDFIAIEDLDTFDFLKVSLIFLCTPALLSTYKDRAVNSGAFIIDCVGILEGTSCIAPPFCRRQKKRLFLNPTTLTLPLLHVLKPIHTRFKIISAQVTALLSASVFGSPAIQLLMDQTRCLYTREEPYQGLFPKIQAFNLIPEASPILARQTTEQLKSFLHFPIHISTCLTPVFQGDAFSLSFVTHKECRIEQLEKLFQRNKYCRLISGISPDLTLSTQEAICGDSIYLMHISSVAGQPRTYHLWVICDSIRRGPIQNAVQIAENLLS